MKPRILTICTGGTIASRVSRDGLTPVMRAEEVLTYVPAVREYCSVSAIQVCNVDSTNMTPALWGEIVRCVREHYGDYDGFVICHGTDTMAYTSAALSYMIRNSDKPVVVTGSQKPIDLEITDAKTNLMDSIRYAADPKSSGVSIVFGGSVIAGTRAKKMRTHSFNAFTSMNFPELASIADGRIVRYIPPEPSAAPVEFTEKLHDSAVVFKLIPGSRPELLEYLFQHYDCLIIESFGVGGLPDTLVEAFCTQMNQWISHGKLIIMATQVDNEGSNMEVYAVGQRIKREFNLLEAYDMTLEATVTKAMYLMERFPGDYEAIRREFYKTVNYDILLG